MSGSLMSPFQPTVVRGFSKYTRMISSIVDSTSAASPFRRPAYSRAAATSWIEHGPTTTNRRGSRRSRMARTASRDRSTVAAARCGERQPPLDLLGCREQVARDDVDVLQSILKVHRWSAYIDVLIVHSSGKNLSSRAFVR